MRSMEVWKMIVQVEREMLAEQDARRKRLGALPDGSPRWSVRMPSPAAWRRLGWARSLRQGIALLRPGRGRSAGGYKGA